MGAADSDAASAGPARGSCVARTEVAAEPEIPNEWGTDDHQGRWATSHWLASERTSPPTSHEIEDAVGAELRATS